MNGDIPFRGLVVSAIVTFAVGAIAFRLLPGWSGLVGELGESGAWILLVVSHLIYGFVIGLATYLFLSFLNRFSYHGSVFGAGLSAGITVLLANMATVWYSFDFGGPFVFSIWIAWVAWIVNFVVFLLTKLLTHSRPSKAG